MKSSIRAALAVGALALASSPAFASSIPVYNGMSPVGVQTSSILPSLDPRWFELSSTATGMLTRLVDTDPDSDPTPSWTVSYEIWQDFDTGTAGSLGGGLLVDSFSFTDAIFSASNPSAWHLTTGGLFGTGNFELKIATNGANSSTSEISAVPLPAAAWLFGSAVLGFGALRRKQKGSTKSEMATA